MRAGQCRRRCSPDVVAWPQVEVVGGFSGEGSQAGSRQRRREMAALDRWGIAERVGGGLVGAFVLVLG